MDQVDNLDFMDSLDRLIYHRIRRSRLSMKSTKSISSIKFKPLTPQLYASYLLSVTSRLVLSLFTAALLAGCAVTPYQPYAGGVGYSEVNVARNRYEVVYHGTRGMDEATAKGYAIYRAAELGKQNGYTHFRIAGARHDAVRSLESDANLFPRRPWTGEAQRMTEWEWRREQELEASRRRLSVREERAPVVALIVEFAGAACETCLSVEEKLAEARAKGILKNQE